MADTQTQISSAREFHDFARTACRTHPVTRDEYDLTWPGMQPGIDEAEFFAQRLRHEARQRFADLFEGSFQRVDDRLRDLRESSACRVGVQETKTRGELIQSLRSLADLLR